MTSKLLAWPVVEGKEGGLLARAALLGGISLYSMIGREPSRAIRGVGRGVICVT